uniref:Uncharacterized protein n=1 Tax=Helicotheca tamesis TaxID=374047 RepID=A0A7S2HI02_9STRA|mmetsp:Transcript_18285/g.25162  ORF Transcript_18285/g.25162 Transcript_18285/m.25162 type:complete len:291 (+) Transcript_18285:538-1410(+)
MEKYNVDYMLYQIDSILVSSEKDVARIRNVLHKHQESEEEESEEGEEKVNWEEFRNAILEKVIWETEDGSIVRISSPPASSKQNMEVVGKVMPPPTNDNPSVLLLDPILAMDTITSNKWVLVDTTSSNTKNSETERYESITSLVEFMGGILSSNPSSPLLLHTTPTTHDDTTNHEKGGIALSCTTKQDIFQAGVSIQSLLCSQSSSAVQMTESGILLPHIMEREEAEFEEGVVDSTMIQRDGDDGGGVGGGGVIRSAVVLPFDAMLWKSALIVFGDDEGYDDENDVGDLI